MDLTIYFIVLLAGIVVAENDNLSCCPPSTYILLKRDVCWEPKTNITTPIRLACDKTIKIVNFDVSAAGQVVIQISDLHKESFSSDIACTGNLTNRSDVNLTQIKPVSLLCLTEEEEEIIADTTLGYCMVVSVVFLGLTGIIYSIFGELRDLLGKSIINFSSSLALGLGILSILKLMSYSDMTMCAVRGFLAYFFLVAAFFWANSISIQVLRDTRRVCTVDYGWREFRWYMVYSWGVPAILTMCMAIVNFHPGDHVRPGIGLNHCWFLNKNQQWYYMYSVMSILLIVNIGIFIYIATMVWRHSFSSSHIKALKFKLTMTVRLIILMGLPWIFEMIGALAGKHLIWAILDVFNALQGIFIFILLVIFRKRVIKVMYKRGWLDCISGPIEKYLAVGDDAEENVVQHTDVPMTDDR